MIGVNRVPPDGRTSQEQGVPGTLGGVPTMLTRRRAVDYRRVQSSLCRSGD